MAVLNAAARKALPTSAFAIPERREFPIHDEEHARAALARAKMPGQPASLARRVVAAVRKKYPSMDVSKA